MADALTHALGSPEVKGMDLEWKIQRAPDSDSGLWEAKAAVGGTVLADDETGVVRLIPTVTGIVDEVEDVILPGAYAKTLSERVPKGVWSHDWKTWVARTDKVGELLPGDDQLPTTWKGKPWPKQAGCAIVEATFNLGTQPGLEAYRNVKFFDAGPLGQQVEYSIGYQVPAGEAMRNSQGWRLIKQLKWFEWCPVLFGAMPLAGTLAADERKTAEGHGGIESKVTRDRIEVHLPPPVPSETSAADALTKQLDIVGKSWTPTSDELAAAHDWDRITREYKLAGREVTPGDVRNTERLKHYWAHGAGALKIGWGRPGDFEKCVHEVGKYMHNPGEVKGYCALRHHEATGFWPGHAPTEQVPGHKGLTTMGMGDLYDPEDEFGGAGGTGGAELKGGAPAAVEDHVDLDDTDGAMETPFDADDAYPTEGGDVTAPPIEAEAKALGDAELKAAGGAMACGKSRANCPHTMPDDSYPIHNADEVEAAVNSYPRGAGKGKTKADIRKHIVAGAKRVKASKKVPNTWPEKRDGTKGIEDEIAEALEAKDYPYLPGSVEERQDELREGLRDLLLPEPDENGNVRAYVSLDATYADRVVATLNDWSSGEGSDEQTFVIPYTVNDAGEVAFSDPQPVEKVVTLQPRSAEDSTEGSDPNAQNVGSSGASGVSPTAPIGRKVVELADLLEKVLAGEAIDGKTVTLTSPTHTRRLRAAHAELAGALSGLGVNLGDAGKLPEEKSAAGGEGVLIDAPEDVLDILKLIDEPATT